MNEYPRHIVPNRGRITREMREQFLGSPAIAVWFTGFSGAGKSTIAHAVEERLYQLGRLAYTFDGDNVRQGLCRDLSFSPKDRAENLRRIAEMINLFLDAGVVCLAAFISPMRSDREGVRDIVGAERFHEIYVRCPLAECEARDVKGLYRMAREGRIREYTGVSAPYEEPENPALILDTDLHSVEECVGEVLRLIGEKCGLDEFSQGKMREERVGGRGM